MEPDTLWQLLLLALLLFGSAFFSASETALMSLSKIKIRHMIEEKVKGAELVGKLLEKPEKILGAILVGNNVVNIGASALATSLSIEYFGNKGVGIATGVMTLLVLVFGEITPKSMAVASSERIAIKVAGFIRIVIKLLNPVIVILTFITNIIIKALGGKIDHNKPLFSEEEFKTLVDVGHEEGILEIEERKMIHNVFQFGDLQVKEAMVPRTNIVAVDINASYNDIMDCFKREQYSRMPVYQHTIDNIIGILYLKDMFLFDKHREQFSMKDSMRKVHYTFESKRISELFEEMRKKRLQMAVVADEYGGTAGIITMQDLVEEIFGDFGNEYDESLDNIQCISEGVYVVDGLTRLSLVNEVIGVKLESEYYDTVGGFVTGIIGRFPRKGEIVHEDQLEYTIMDVSRTSIKRLSISVINKE